MFDIGLSELMLIAVVALVVIGPERLPKVARTAGHILGRLQRYVSDVKADINREMQLDELKTLQKQMTEQVNSISNSVTHEMREVETSVSSVIEPLKGDVAVLPAPTSDEDLDPNASAPPKEALRAEVKEAPKT